MYSLTKQFANSKMAVRMLGEGAMSMSPIAVEKKREEAIFVMQNIDHRMAALIMICFGIIQAMPSTMLAEESTTIQCALGDKERELAAAYAEIHLGKGLVDAGSFLYFDYSDHPCAYAVRFLDPRSGRTAGTIYLAVESCALLEIMRSEPLHSEALQAVQEWLPEHVGALRNPKLQRVYFSPLMYPILKISIDDQSGSQKVLIVDPEHRQIIAPQDLDRLALNCPAQLALSRGMSMPSEGAPATVPQSSDGAFITKQLAVYEVSILGNASGCAAETVTNILGYWNDKGCSFFPTRTDQTDVRYVNLLMDDLAASMKTDDRLKADYWNVAPGTKKTVRQYGATCTTNIAWFGRVLYENIVSEIDHDRPCLLAGSFGDSLYNKHAVCAIGYKQNVGWGIINDRYLIVHDNYSITPNQPVEVPWYVFWSILYNPAFYMSVHLSDCKSLVGTWSVVEYNELFEPKNETGTLTINPNSTYAMQLTSFSFEGEWRLERNYVDSGSDVVTFYVNDVPRLMGFVSESYDVIEDGYLNLPEHFVDWKAVKMQ
jgi:hypothetical protein